MTLPSKDPKAYLEVDESGPQPVIEGEPAHVAELEELFSQRGIPTGRGPGKAPGREALELRGSDVEQARELLEGYKSAKGS